METQVENLKYKSMGKRTFATKGTYEYVEDHQNDVLDNISYNSDATNCWELLSPEFSSFSSDNYDDECAESININRWSDDSLKTILTVDECELLRNDAANEDDESRRSETTLQAMEVDDYEIKLYNDQYPIPADPGLVSGFWVLYPKSPVHKFYGDKKVEDFVPTMKLQQIQRVREMLNSTQIDLEYYGVNSTTLREIFGAATENSTIQTLNLKDNWLSIDDCYHLNELLRNNNVLSSVNLSGCHIGPRGAKRIQEGIGAAPRLRYLNVSRCDLGDEGLTYISTGVYCSLTLENLNLRDNKLGDGSGIQLQIMLTQTDCLKVLNLSWNSLHSLEFWKKFTDGLNRNTTLTHLDLARNSLGKECTPLLAKYLANSQHLEAICLQGNEFVAEEAVQIAQALRKNTILKMFHFGNNPIGHNGAYAIIKDMAAQDTAQSQMTTLDLENIWATKDVIPLLEEIKIKRPSLQLKLKGILSNYEIEEPDPRPILLKRANFEAMKPKKKRQRKKFGQFVLSLEDKINTRESFQKLIKGYKLKLRKALVVEIMNAFTIGIDAIDQGALKSFYLKEYPDTSPAPEKLKKKKISKKRKKKVAKSNGKKKAY